MKTLIAFLQLKSRKIIPGNPLSPLAWCCPQPGGVPTYCIICLLFIPMQQPASQALVIKLLKTKQRSVECYVFWMLTFLQ